VTTDSCNQNYDAEILTAGLETPLELEIGRAIDGYQDRLMLEKVTEDGHASPFSTYERSGKGVSRTVATLNPRSSIRASAEVERLLGQLCDVAKKKSRMTYDPPIFLLLYIENDIAFRGDNLKSLRKGSEHILSHFDWVFESVDVICGSNGLIASYSE